MGYTDESIGLYEGNSHAQLTAKKVIVTFVLTEFTQVITKLPLGGVLYTSAERSARCRTEAEN
jgi:hypothetical protein